MPDISMHADAMYGSLSWAALRMGHTKDWFFKARAALEVKP